MKVCIWSSFKVSMYKGELQQQQGESDYAFLQRVEDNGEISSVIEVNDKAQLDTFLEATYNETDIQLEYQILDNEFNPVNETTQATA